jgi:hypothetical protein
VDRAARSSPPRVRLRVGSRSPLSPPVLSLAPHSWVLAAAITIATAALLSYWLTSLP